MGKDTHIEWANHTFNPWEGCTAVSAGCKFCYAETRNARFGGGIAPNWGKGAPRRRTSAANWREPLRWNREAEKAGERPRVFCASLADVFDGEVPHEWRADLFSLIRQTPQLDWLLLTKRPESVGWLLDSARSAAANESLSTAMWLDDWINGNGPTNVWLGTSVENQAAADVRIPALLGIPARVHFLSCEPLLGPLDLQGYLRLSECWTARRQEDGTWQDVPGTRHFERREWGLAQAGIPEPRGIDWIIAGYESGPSARPGHPDWARGLRDQCQVARVPFLFKQHGEWLADTQRDFRLDVGDKSDWGLVSKSGEFRLVMQGDKRLPGSDPTWREGETGIARVGKKKAGRVLDAREWNELPKVAP